jgi:hypothetical protein
MTFRSSWRWRCDGARTSESGHWKWQRAKNGWRNSMAAASHRRARRSRCCARITAAPINFRSLASTSTVNGTTRNLAAGWRRPWSAGVFRAWAMTSIADDRAAWHPPLPELVLLISWAHLDGDCRTGPGPAHDGLSTDRAHDGTGHAGHDSRNGRPATSARCVSKRDAAMRRLNLRNVRGTNRARISRTDSYDARSRQMSAAAGAAYQMQMTAVGGACSQGFKS